MTSANGTRPKEHIANARPSCAAESTLELPKANSATPIDGPATVMIAEMGSRINDVSREPYERSLTNLVWSPLAAARLIRGSSAVSNDTPITPYGSWNSSHAFE